MPTGLRVDALGRPSGLAQGQQGLSAAVGEKGAGTGGRGGAVPSPGASGTDSLCCRALCPEDTGFRARSGLWQDHHAGPGPLNVLYSSCVRASPQYLPCEQLEAVWGAPSAPTVPAPGLPLWASASRDPVPTTCLPPGPSSSSSFASVTPAPKVGGPCAPATPSPVPRGPVCVLLCPRPGPAGSGRLAPPAHVCVLTASLCPRRVRSTVFSLVFSSFHVSFPPSLLPAPSPSCHSP